MVKYFLTSFIYRDCVDKKKERQFLAALSIMRLEETYLL